MMKQVGSGVASFLVFFAAGCTAAPEPEDTSVAIQAVRAAGDQEVAAFSSGDVGSLIALFTEDAVVMPPNELTIVGRDNLRVWAEGVLQQITMNARYPTSDVVVIGDWAIQRYTFVETVTPKAGGPATEESGKGLHVLRRQSDGRWLIAQDIWSNDAPLPPQSQ